MLNIFSATIARLIPSALKTSQSTEHFDPATATAADWVEHLAQLKSQVEQKYGITVYVRSATLYLYLSVSGLPIDLATWDGRYIFLPQGVQTPALNLMYRTNETTLVLDRHTAKELEKIYRSLLSGRTDISMFPVMDAGAVTEMYQEERDECLESLANLLQLPELQKGGL